MVIGGIDFGHLLFGFQGRINRAKYWLAILVYVVINVLLAIIGMALGDSIIFMLLNVIVGLAVLISGIAVGLKRLHDRNKSGWWLILFYLLPGLLFGVGMFMSLAGIMGADISSGSGVLLSFLGFVIGIWALVELGCLRGTVGPNQYGPDPLGGEHLMAGGPGAPRPL